MSKRRVQGEWAPEDLLLQLEDVLDEEIVQRLIGEVDAQLGGQHMAKKAFGGGPIPQWGGACVPVGTN